MTPTPPTPVDVLRAGPPAEPGAGLEHALERFRRAAQSEGLLDVAWASVDSPVGALVVAATPQGLVCVSWELDDALDELARRVSPRVLEAPARLDGVRRQLDEYFAGRRRRFEVPVDWTLVAGFRREVLQVLSAEVPYGATATYGELARRVGNPRASRAVGSAMATNPLPIVVPCHRVLRAGGSLGNYSGRGGADTKRWLLGFEGAIPAR
ncbi:MAG: methylated-DNA--[protein]-cysteine S-methyltransferase [Acidimicrobiales bacterium]|jgi:methylated-DNA-[protein]-cysteine S-methyltransferase|nr:methylated-DNA--[protein]-cysteine S-methyltransferase [Acidimicrobiales bacterium]